MKKEKTESCAQCAEKQQTIQVQTLPQSWVVPMGYWWGGIYYPYPVSTIQYTLPPTAKVVYNFFGNPIGYILN